MPHVLLIEDDDLLAELTAEALTVDGHEVTIARTAADAREAIAECDRAGRGIDLVLTDVMLPDGRGPEVVDEARRTNPGLKVLFMSGYGAAAGDHGAPPDVLMKPFRLAEVLDRVRALVGSGEQAR
jgi:DNA-binding response OmpR family regulator